MPRRKRLLPLPLPERNACWQRAGLPALTDAQAQTGQLPDLLSDWINWLGKTPPKRPEEMYCFICYDIEEDKIRRLVARTLLREGCVRVQKSVFFARIHRKRYHRLTDLLRQIQTLYENQDMLNSLQCIGQTFELDLMLAPPNTLFV
jgi:CRISPR-associated protein Cas2